MIRLFFTVHRRDDRDRCAPRRELAAVARSDAQRHQRRDEPAALVVAVTNVAWKLPMPALSGSTPIIWGKRIFLNVADDLKMTHGVNLHLWCVDRETGTVLWQRPLGAGNHQERKQNMSTPSPVTDGTRVWVMTGTGILKAFDFEGNEIWMRDIQKDYGHFGLNWGYGSSPLLEGDSLFVQVLHGMHTDDPSYLLRIDKDDRQDDLESRATHTGARRIARRLHDAGRPALRRLDRDRRDRR